jgi:hypothetical protein
MADERNQPHPQTIKQSPPLEPTKAEAPKEAPKPKTEAERRGEIAAEYETLLSQSQDELSIIKALCSKYSIDQVALGELMADSRKSGVSGAKGLSQPAHPDQMGIAPAKGTVQSGKEPKTS